MFFSWPLPCSSSLALTLAISLHWHFWKLIEKTLSMMFLFLHLLHVPPLLGARRTLWQQYHTNYAAFLLCAIGDTDFDVFIWIAWMKWHTAWFSTEKFFLFLFQLGNIMRSHVWTTVHPLAIITTLLIYYLICYTINLCQNQHILFNRWYNTLPPFLSL